MNIKKIVSIIAVLIWMSIIFGFSNQQGEGSGNTSKKISKAIVQIIDMQYRYSEQEKDKLIEIVEPILRKVAHLTIYAIGGIVIANCVWQFWDKEKMAIGISTGVGVMYAISDEIHQLMVDGRSGNVRDVIIDSIGILIGIMVFLLIKGVFGRNVKKKKECRGGE
ncbi:MAG: VanZ family protein [Clostridia bacterium]|nr:VanZ family protein [Clostridia bacterium]